MFLFFAGNFLLAQTQYIDVIYLKNGSKVKGTIIEFVPTISYTIRTADSSIFVFKVEEIAKIAKEEVKPPVESKKEKSSQDSFIPGYRGIVEGGFGAGTGLYGLNTACFAFSNGYQFNENLYAGVATGLNYYPSNGSGADGFGLIPFYADARYSFLPQNPVSPYASLGAGFSFDPNQGFEGSGFYFNPSLGTQFAVKGKYKVNLGFNYRIQQMYFLNVTPNGVSSVIRFSESAGFSLGFVF